MPPLFGFLQVLHPPTQDSFARVTLVPRSPGTVLDLFSTSSALLPSSLTQVLPPDKQTRPGALFHGHLPLLPPRPADRQLPLLCSVRSPMCPPLLSPPPHLSVEVANSWGTGLKTKADILSLWKNKP